MLPDGHIREQADVLERARNSGARDPVRWLAADVGTAKQHRTPARAVGARDNVEQRRLSGAVGADDADDLFRQDIQRNVVESVDAAERLGDRRQRQKWPLPVGHARPPRDQCPEQRAIENSLAAYQQHGDQQCAEGRQSPVGEEAQLFGQQDQQQRADQRSQATVEPPRMTASTKSIERSKPKLPGSI